MARRPVIANFESTSSLRVPCGVVNLVINADSPKRKGFGKGIATSDITCKVRKKVYDKYRVTHQVEPNLPLTSKQKFRFGLARQKQNLCYDVNGRFGSTWSVALYIALNFEAAFKVQRGLWNKISKGRGWENDICFTRCKSEVRYCLEETLSFFLIR